MKKKIFLLYPYYYPHYKAGGPVQSIYNLAGYFRNEMDFFLISLSRDIDNTASEIPFASGSWTKGPQGESIYYTSAFSLNLIRKLIVEVRPDVVFVNGLFNASTTIPGVLLAKWCGVKLIISPRGMLQAWALKQSRTLLKNTYIRFLKALVGRDTEWHATDELERNDIQHFFGRSAIVHVASNIPRSLAETTALGLVSGKEAIRLVFLSLINPNKNLHLVIDAVNSSQGKFILDIYGPVADQSYWDICQQRMHANNSAVNYKGPVVPWQVQSILKQYHFFVLPTQGENFGHAIFDALSSGVPVIISKNTPWREIDRSGAGYYIDLETSDSLSNILDQVHSLSENQYENLRHSAYAFASNFLKQKDYQKEYQFLFD